MKPVKALVGLAALIVLVLIFGGDKTPKQSASVAFSSASTSALRSVSPPAQAVAPELGKLKEMYVGAKTLNARSSPNGKVVAKLQPTTRVEIYAEQSQWGRISADNVEPRWVSIAHLCETRDCGDGRIERTPTSPPATPITSVATLSSLPPRSMTTYVGSGCSCSSGKNCTGPRGGRYCITSGGNKRYR